MPSLVAQLVARLTADLGVEGRESGPQLGHLSFVEIDHELVNVYDVHPYSHTGPRHVSFQCQHIMGFL